MVSRVTPVVLGPLFFSVGGFFDSGSGLQSYSLEGGINKHLWERGERKKERGRERRQTASDGGGERREGES